MQREQDLTQEKEEDLKLERINLRYRHLAITEELDRRERERNSRRELILIVIQP